VNSGDLLLLATPGGNFDRGLAAKTRMRRQRNGNRLKGNREGLRAEGLRRLMMST